MQAPNPSHYKERFRIGRILFVISFFSYSVYRYGRLETTAYWAPNECLMNEIVALSECNIVSAWYIVVASVISCHFDSRMSTLPFQMICEKNGIPCIFILKLISASFSIIFSHKFDTEGSAFIFWLCSKLWNWFNLEKCLQNLAENEWNEEI